MVICNKCVACTPFEVKSIELQVKGGFATAKQKTSLTELTVVHSDDEYIYCPGDKVWVKSDSFKLAWAKDEYELDGKVVILVPFAAVLVHEGGTS